MGVEVEPLPLHAAVAEEEEEEVWPEPSSRWESMTHWIEAQCCFERGLGLEVHLEDELVAVRRSAIGLFAAQ